MSGVPTLEMIETAIANHNKIKAILYFYLLKEKNNDLRRKLQIAFGLDVEFDNLNHMMFYVRKDSFSSMEEFKESIVYLKNDFFTPSIIALCLQQKLHKLRHSRLFGTGEENKWGFKVHSVDFFYDKHINKTFVFSAFDEKYLLAQVFEGAMETRKQTNLCSTLQEIMNIFT